MHRLVQLAIVPPEPHHAHLRRLQEEYSTTVASEKWREAPAHITLVHANKVADVERLLARLRETVAAHAPLDITMPTIGYFRHHPTLYYTVAPSDALQRLHEDLLETMNDVRERSFNAYTRPSIGRAGELLREYGSEYVLERYFPHLSLTRHDSDKEKFRDLVRDLPMGKPITFTAEEIVVLERTQEGKWTELARVRLGN